ncbi:MAG: zinc ribbon domain-containing protein [Deltaproteobacteria bacterium]|nr:zinc ribbon domain-containing protein [Deltaproteobacteria bacterium]
MPIYEYRCESCNGTMSALILKPDEEKNLSCRHCRSLQIVRILSSCSVHKTDAQRVAEFDPKAPKGNGFYNDDRNVGLWAQKRLDQLGVDLGPQFDETLEKARSSKILDNT